MSDACRLLPWDTAFFGHQIGRLEIGRPDSAALREAENWARLHRVDCLYVLADEPIQDDWAGYQPVDDRVTLLAPTDAAEPDGTGVRTARAEDADILRTLASVNHRDSRFYADARLAPHADRLFARWMEQSLDDTGGIVLVPAGAEVSGYVTCSAAGRIGLLGVSSRYRGQGLGRRLVGAALAWCRVQSIPVTEVVTQARNAAARGLYESCGFRTARVQHWYHRWFDATA